MPDAEETNPMFSIILTALGYGFQPFLSVISLINSEMMSALML
jgi:hypothetical protein